MRIEQVAAHNFKCFSSIDLKLADITILTGANSSGKSSFLHALLVPFQSTSFPFYLSPNGEYANLGDFLSMSHGHNRDAIIDFDIKAVLGEDEKLELKTSWTLDTSSSQPQLQQLKFNSPFLELKVSKSKGNKPYVLDVDFDNAGYQRTKEYLAAKAIESSFKALAPWRIASFNGRIKGERFDSLRNLHSRVASLYPVLVQLTGFTRINDNINFIDSFRYAPERTYYEKTKVDKIRRYGENYIDQIVEWERFSSRKFKALKTCLKEFKLLTGMSSSRMRGGRFEMLVKPDRRGVRSLINDVGFGVSQFLPVITADIQLGEGSTLIVSQPEIHLHPSVQAKLGDYFTEMVKGMKRRYIIETHSEYFLHRMRLLIAKGDFDPTRIAVYHFERVGHETKVYEVKFMKSGKIEGAPKDFFDTYMIDVMDIAMNAS